VQCALPVSVRPDVVSNCYKGRRATDHWVHWHMLDCMSGHKTDHQWTLLAAEQRWRVHAALVSRDPGSWPLWKSTCFPRRPPPPVFRCGWYQCTCVCRSCCVRNKLWSKPHHSHYAYAKNTAVRSLDIGRITTEAADNRMNSQLLVLHLWTLTLIIIIIIIIERFHVA